MGVTPDRSPPVGLASSEARIAAALATVLGLAALVYDPAASAADPKRTLALAIGTVLTAAWVARRLRLGGAAHGPAVPLPALLLAMTAGWWCITLLWGSPSGAREAGTWVGGATVALVTGSLAEATVRRVAQVASAIIGAGTALVVLTQVGLDLPPMSWHGGHGNPDWAGLVLALALLPACGLVAQLRGQQHRAWLLAAAGVVLELPALWLTHSRTAWIALAVGAAVAGAGARRPRLAAGAVLLGVAAVAIALSLPPVSRLLWSTRTDAMAETVRGLAGRSWISTSSAQAALDHAPLGAGAGRFGHAYLDAQAHRLRYLPLPAASQRFHNATTAHSDWLQAATVAGLPGLAMLALALGLALLDHLRQGRRWLAGASATLLVCATGDSALARPAVLLLAALVLGANSRTVRLRRAEALASVAALGLCAWLLASSTRGWVASRWVTQALAMPPLERVARLEAAARLDPRSGVAALELGLLRLALGDPSGAAGELAKSRRLLANVGTEVALGNAYVALGELGSAEAALRRALHLHPASFRAHANLAVVLIRNGDLVRAEQHLHAAQRLWPGHARLPAIAEQLRHTKLERASGG